MKNPTKKKNTKVVGSITVNSVSTNKAKPAMKVAVKTLKPAQGRVNNSYPQSQFSGISATNSTVNPWKAVIILNSKYHYVGVFKTEGSAVRAYNKKYKELTGKPRYKVPASIK